jgi:pyruvate/2-oxoglutarate dehydrogenase complex dihydrolipoamide dehydrogenase (E3) component/uncharacterized membrane protein YdjX (TVP38/TMEM64 family)
MKQAGRSRSGTPGKLLLAVVVIAAVVVFLQYDLGKFFTFDALKEHREALRGHVEANRFATMAVFFLVYVVMAALSIPGAGVMTLAGGAMFGLVTGVVLVSFSSSIGAVLAFLGARFLFRDYVKKKLGERLAAIEKGIDRDGALYLLTLRLVPAVPFFVVNLLMGLTNIKSRTFYAVSQFGMLPGTMAYVYAGTQIAQIDSVSDVVSPGLLLAFAIIGIMPLLMKLASRYLQSRRVYRGYARPKKYDYNLLAIGAGSAGLVTSYIGSAVKAKVALIERHKMGGDCLNTGCVPSKALIRSAKAMYEIRHGQTHGIAVGDVEFDFAKAMERVADVVRKVEPHDSVERYTQLGVQCIQGEARLISPWEVEVDGRRVTAKNIVIATGARPLVPRIEGLDQVEYLTSDTLWSLRKLPSRLLVLGGGPIGCELSQTFARLGSSVVQVEMLPRLLSREDPDVSAIIAKRFEQEGIQVATSHKAIRIEKASWGGVLICEHEGQQVRFEFDRILLALGRRPNTEGFRLQEVGVKLSPNGTVDVNDKMQTNVPNIYACGDFAGPYQFTHTASHQAWYAAVNSLLAPFWSFNVDYRTIPWATFTDPEVARVGLSQQEADQRGIEYEVTEYGIDDLDRAIADGTDAGFVKVLTVPRKDKILGAVIVGAHASDILAEFVLAMKHGLGLNKILGTIHTYPTMAEANKYVAGNWKRAHAPKRVLEFAEKYFAYRIS